MRIDARRFVPTRQLVSRAEGRRRLESARRLPRFAEDESVEDESDDDDDESDEDGDGTTCSLAFDDKHDDDSS